MENFLRNIWIQAHGLQLRAMTKGTGEKLGRLLCEVLDVRSDYDGVVMGRCVRIRALVDINKPLYRWTTTNIEGVASRIIFRCEKVVDYASTVGGLATRTKIAQIYPQTGRSTTEHG